MHASYLIGPHLVKCNGSKRDDKTSVADCIDVYLCSKIYLDSFLVSIFAYHESEHKLIASVLPLLDLICLNYNRTELFYKVSATIILKRCNILPHR